MNWVCKECGGKNVESKVWVDMNTDEILDGPGEYDEDNYWCRDCNKHNFVILEEDYLKQKE